MNSTINKYSNITDLDGNDNMLWFVLPWNAIYGVHNLYKELSSAEIISSIHNKYLAIIGDNYYLREYVGKKYHRNKTFEIDSYDLFLDECSKIMSIICLSDGIYVVETAFSPDIRENGYYKTYLEGKYYYHLIDKSKGISRENLVSISTDNNIIYGADLTCNDALKLVRGE